MTNIVKTLALVAVATMACASCTSGNADKNGPITTEVKPRPEGQQSMVGFAAAPLDTVRVGFIGLGMRGPDAVDRFAHIPDTKIVALCDIDSAKVARSQQILSRNGRPEAAGYYGSEDAWKQLVERPDIDLVYIATDWATHTPMALYSMEQGKHAAIEVPAATSLDEIWDLVNTSERTRRHCMMLENCVYDFVEMNTLNMAQQGLFGDIMHVEGAYLHDLTEFWPEYWNNWRLEFNRTHKGDIYPTHGMGPAAQLLDLHRGDRMTTLVAMDTKAVNGPKVWKEQVGDSVEFAQGDHTTTLIRTANGKTIEIQHDVLNPRPYSRAYELTGTKGYAAKYPVEGYSFMPEKMDSTAIPDYQNLSAHATLTPDQQKALLEKYTHPIIREVGDYARTVGGHGGMDYIMDYRLVYCLHNGLPLDMDVYDMAEWCSLGPLGAISIENGYAPVEVPDFTRGDWNRIKGYRHAMVPEKKMERRRTSFRPR